WFDRRRRKMAEGGWQRRAGLGHPTYAPPPNSKRHPPLGGSEGGEPGAAWLLAQTYNHYYNRPLLSPIL
ncbi:hypothetical protein NY486_06815, partial [Enterobacter hormaechei]|nr:hypothetical protein [Enterobacter hormaechei]